MRAAMFNGREYTRCEKHGGKAGRPSKTGQRSELVGKRIFELSAEMENDEGLTSVEEQVKIAAALVIEYVNGALKLKQTEFTHQELFKLMALVKELHTMTKGRHQVREGQLYTVRTEHVILVVNAVVEIINDELADLPEIRDRLAGRIINTRVLKQEEQSGRPAITA